MLLVPYTYEDGEYDFYVYYQAYKDHIDYDIYYYVGNMVFKMFDGLIPDDLHGIIIKEIEKEVQDDSYYSDMDHKAFYGGLT